MNGFIEHTGGIFRMGPDAIAYGDKFVFSAAFVGDGQRAIVKALVSPDKLFSKPYMTRAFQLLRDSNFRRADWDHEGEHFTVDLTHEPFIIRKEHTMSVREAFDAATANGPAAIQEAYALSPELGTAVEKLHKEHLAAESIALDETLSTEDRIVACIPLARAADAVKAAGAAHGDPSHPGHARLGAHLLGYKAVMDAVIARETAPIPH